MDSYSIKRILVPVDLSQTSLNALATAGAIAKKKNAQLFILNVSEANYKPQHFNTSKEVSNDVLLALTMAVDHANDITSKLIQTTGHVVESIITASLEERCDLIVIGTHGASGYREGFIGSNTYNVLKYSECPVLTIPPGQKYQEFKNVLLPVRLVNAASIGYDVVSSFLSEGTILQIFGLPYQKMQNDTTVMEKVFAEILKLLKSDNVNVKCICEKSECLEIDILKFAQNNQADLLILNSSIDATSKSNYVGPHTQKLVNHSKIPVLNINKIGRTSFHPLSKSLQFEME